LGETGGEFKETDQPEKEKQRSWPATVKITNQKGGNGLGQKILQKKALDPLGVLKGGGLGLEKGVKDENIQHWGLLAVWG